MYDALLQILQASIVTRDPQIIHLTRYGQEAFRVTVRAIVTPTLTFQVWLNHNPHHTRYAYQLFSHSGTLLRWDNAPHHQYLGVNFPHHFHDDQSRITPSALQGDPLQDLPAVLAEIEHYLPTSLEL